MVQPEVHRLTIMGSTLTLVRFQSEVFTLLYYDMRIILPAPQVDLCMKYVILCVDSPPGLLLSMRPLLFVSL